MSNAVAAWGAAQYWQLAVGFKVGTVLTPTPALVGDVRDIAGGGEWTLFLKDDGGLESVGSNMFGALGDGTRETRQAPVPVQGLPDEVLQVVAANEHVVCLLANGSVMTWGTSIYGVIGDGGPLVTAEGPCRTLPVQLPLKDVVWVATGGGCCGAVRSDGTVAMWGVNNRGNLADGTTEARTAPQQIPGLTGAKRIAIGGNATTAHLLVLLDDGTVLGAGSGFSGELGLGLTLATPTLTPVGLTDVVELACGDEHSLARRADGSVWACGSCVHGETGVPPTSVRKDGQPCLPAWTQVLAAGAQSISARGHQSFIVLEGGTALAFGLNHYGQLGDGTREDRPAPTPLSLTGVIAVCPGFYQTHALQFAGHAPDPVMSVIPLPGALEVRWVWAQDEPWKVGHKTVVAKTKTPLVWEPVPSPSQRSFVISHLASGQPYEVVVDGKDWEEIRMVSTPL